MQIHVCFFPPAIPLLLGILFIMLAGVAQSAPQAPLPANQPMLIKRMENVPPRPDQALALWPIDRGPLQAPQPGGHLIRPPVAPSIISNSGAPGINLPCGWLDGRHPTYTVFGSNAPVLVSQRFFLPPGRYNILWRWTRPIRPGKYTRLCTTRFVNTRHYRKKRSCILAPQRPASTF